MAIDYDEILSYIGELGTWQKKLFLLLSIPAATSAMAVFMYDFIAFVPDHRCYIDSCDNSSSSYQEDFLNFTIPWNAEDETYSKCQMYQQKNNSADQCLSEDFDEDFTSNCLSWKFNDDLIHSTAVEDFEMICGNKSRKSLTQTMYMVGMLIGSFLFGWLSDLIGRKTTLMIGLICLTLGGSLPFFITASVKNFYTIVIFRFISGMGHVGTFMMAFNLALECVGLKYRTLFGILIETPFAIGGLIVGLVSYAGIRDWKLLALVLSAPNLLLIVLLMIVLPESPRWLITKNKKKQLVKVLEKAAKVNKQYLPIDRILQSDAEEEKLASEENLKSATVLDLFWPPTILLRSTIMFLNWLVTTMCYYGLTSAAATLTPDLYLNFTLAILVEIPSHFACILLLDRIGRKTVLGSSQLLAGITCIIAGLITSENLRWLQITFALIGKFGASASFAIVFVYTAEMFPTEIRSTAVGASSLCGRIGGIIAPQIAMLNTIWLPLPLLVMGAGSFIGGLLVFVFLPETLGKKLPDSMQEALNL